MSNLSISPLSFTGTLQSTLYQKGESIYKKAKTTPEQDQMVKDLAFEILGRKNNLYAEMIPREKADKMYDLIEKITGLKFQRAKLEKAMYCDDTRMILADRYTRILGGENISLYF